MIKTLRTGFHNVKLILHRMGRLLAWMVLIVYIFVAFLYYELALYGIAHWYLPSWYAWTFYGLWMFITALSLYDEFKERYL